MVAMVDRIPTGQNCQEREKGWPGRLSPLMYEMTVRSSHSLHHNHQHHQYTSPSMPSSRHFRKYSSPTLTPSPLRRKSFVPLDSDLDGDSDLDAQPFEPDDLFRRSSTSSTKPLRNHFGSDSQ